MPERPYGSDGWRPTDEVRLRPSQFFVVLEELWENEDGLREWRHCTRPIELKKAAR